MADSLLSGFRALDLTDEKGFLCCKILSDMGVDTIKIEKPGGDPARNIPPFYHDTPDPEKSLNWFAYNNNKRSITIDLETSKGRDLFMNMVEKVDFVIESFPPGYMASLGLDYSNLTRINPRIIMTSITPFGRSGPYSGYKASDIGIQAMGVLLSQQGDPDRAPVRTSIPQAYMHAGAEAAEGTMIALYNRGLTGEGQHVDVSAMESILWVAERAVPYWDASRTEFKRSGRVMQRELYPIPSIWECKDGYVSFSIQASFRGASSNESLTKWLDSANMAPEFMNKADWERWDWALITQAELDSLVNTMTLLFKGSSADKLMEEGEKRGLRIEKVCDSSDTVNNVQLKARDFWVKIEHEYESLNRDGIFS
ncbi:CaiB/BaiF CoA transferase family protein [Thermodesulfobacteriota bacterium]